MAAPISPPLTPFCSGRKPSLFELGEVLPTDDPVVAVIGTGYVGTHLLYAFGTKYSVIAYDISKQRIRDLDAELADNGEINDYVCTTDTSDLVRATHYLISVPTILLQETNTVDMTHLRSAITTVSNVARKGATIVIESSVAVGMTRDLLGELSQGDRFYVGMSPERVDPGRSFPSYESVPKVISGLTDEALATIKKLYDPVFDNVVTVSKPEVAEMVKLYENCQRMVCIAYANEMYEACRQLGLDGYEVAKVAATKPFGYLDVRPGPGVGGHCIPVNPWYLQASVFGGFDLLMHATKMMEARPKNIANEVTRNGAKKTLVVGVAFKPGQDVICHSPGLAIARQLQKNEVEVKYADPMVSDKVVKDIPREGNWDIDTLSKYDAIIVAMKQNGLQWSVLDEAEKKRSKSTSICGFFIGNGDGIG